LTYVKTESAKKNEFSVRRTNVTKIYLHLAWQPVIESMEDVPMPRQQTTFRAYPLRIFGVLFIDSPAGSGYSIAEKDEDIPTDENQVAEHLYIALKQLYNSLPEFSNRLLFVAGESYAGKYVPALGHYILMKSKKNSTDNEELGSLGYGGSKLPFGLGGLLIGNGLTDPEIQVQTHANVAYNFGLIDRN